jgi:hypothetical protein
VSSYSVEAHAFPAGYAKSLRKQILRSPYLAANTLNRDFVATRGFSVIFRRDGLARVTRELPYLEPYVRRVTRDDCNAFYLNPLQLLAGSRVDPHIDRSLQSFSVHVEPPVVVSVLYVDVPPDLRGGALVLRRGKKHVGRITPEENTLVFFDGDLTHSVDKLESDGSRLSVVCEQYRLLPDELERIPTYAIQSRALRVR